MYSTGATTNLSYSDSVRPPFHLDLCAVQSSRYYSYPSSAVGLFQLYYSSREDRLIIITAMFLVYLLRPTAQGPRLLPRTPETFFHVDSHPLLSTAIDLINSQLYHFVSCPIFLVLVHEIFQILQRNCFIGLAFTSKSTKFFKVASLP